MEWEMFEPARANSARLYPPESRTVLQELEPSIRAYIRRAVRTQDEELALLGDVLVELCIVVDLGTSPESLWKRVRPVIRRCIREYKRQARYEARVDRNVDVDQIAAAKEPATGDESILALREWLDRALAHLTVLQRAALELRAIDGLRDIEIADELGCSRNSVRVLRHYAKRSVRERIRRGIIPPPPDNVSVAHDCGH